mgnify:CR=1 FL=1
MIREASKSEPVMGIDEDGWLILVVHASKKVLLDGAVVDSYNELESRELSDRRLGIERIRLVQEIIARDLQRKIADIASVPTRA